MTWAIVLVVAIAMSSCSSGLRNLTTFEANCWNIRSIGDQIGPLADKANTDLAAARRVRTLERLLARKLQVARKDLGEKGPFNTGDDCLEQGADLEALAWGLTSSTAARGHAKAWYQLLLDYYPDSPLAGGARAYISHPSPIRTP
ncbi:MAG TPA: hypothetical protein VID47_06075 [Actinomycetota bacterium]